MDQLGDGRAGASWLWFVVGLIVVVTLLDVAPKWGGMLLVVLVFAMLGAGFERGTVERIQ